MATAKKRTRTPTPKPKITNIKMLAVWGRYRESMIRPANHHLGSIHYTVFLYTISVVSIWASMAQT